MRKAKKVLGPILAAALIFGCTACGTEGTDVRESNNKSEESTQGAESGTESRAEESTSSGESETAEDEKDAWVPDENKTYNYTWCFYQTAPIADEPVMFDFYKDKFNITFDVWDIDATAATEILANRIIGGEIPDKFSVADQATLTKYVEQGIIAEIPEEMLEMYAPNLLAAIDRDIPGALDYCKIDGKLYALPTYSVNLARAPVAWRMDWLKAVGIEKVPETLDEFEEAIYAFATQDPDGNGKNDTYGISESALTAVYGAYGYIPYINSQGSHMPGLWQIRDGHLVNAAVQPEMKEALERIAKWYQDGVVDPEFVTGENQGGYWALSHAFINGRIGVSGMGQTYHWMPALYEGGGVGQNLEELYKIQPDAEVVLGNPPKGPYGQGTFANAAFKEEKVVFGIQMGEEPDKMAKILSVLNWVYESKENYKIASGGIEGVHWENQERTALDGVTDVDSVALGDWSDGKVRNANFAHTALTFISPSWGDSADNAQMRWAKANNVDKYRYTTSLFAALPSAGLYQSELTSYVEETYFAIISGTQPVDYFDTFVETWRNMGGETLEKEADEWYQSVKGN